MHVTFAFPVNVLVNEIEIVPVQHFSENKRHFDVGEVLSQAPPRPERERLAGFFVVLALGVQPAIRLEEKRVMEIGRVVRHRPRGSVDFGTSGDIHTVDEATGTDAWEALRSGWVDAEAFGNDGLEVRELLRRGGGDIAGGREGSADLGAKC